MQLSFGIEEELAFIGTGKYDFDAFPDLCQSAKLAQILLVKISYAGFETEKEEVVNQQGIYHK